MTLRRKKILMPIECLRGTGELTLAARIATKPENAAALAASSAHLARCKRTRPERVAFAAKGGKARASGMTAERRSEIARKAAVTRWKREKPG